MYDRKQDYLGSKLADLSKKIVSNEKTGDSLNEIPLLVYNSNNGSGKSSHIGEVLGVRGEGRVSKEVVTPVKQVALDYPMPLPEKSGLVSGRDLDSMVAAGAVAKVKGSNVNIRVDQLAGEIHEFEIPNSEKTFGVEVPEGHYHVSVEGAQGNQPYQEALALLRDKSIFSGFSS